MNSAQLQDTKATPNNYASIYTNKELSRNETKKTIPLK